MAGTVLLVVNCQQDRSYGNRQVLRKLYGGRFPHMAFAVGGTCVPDPEYQTISSAWQPRLRNNLCGCCDPANGRHPAGVHLTQSRLIAVAGAIASDGFDAVLWVEDDCLLGPEITPETILQRLKSANAIVGPMWFTDRDSTTWVWARHPTGYAAFDAVAGHFDRQRLIRNWSQVSERNEPLAVLYTPLFGGFVDWLACRMDLLRGMVEDLDLLQEVWHELAIPTAMVHHTSRLAPANGLALWGAERNRPRDELFDLLAGRDYVHPIKLSYYSAEEVVESYRRVADRSGRGLRC